MDNTPVDVYTLNMQQRSAVLANAVEMKQAIQTLAVNPVTQTLINIAPRNVGLIKGFIIEVSGILTNGAGTVASLTNFGVSNLLTNIQFADLNNNVRVNVPGWYLAFLNSVRQGWVYGGAYTPNVAIGYGNTYAVNQGPATIAASTDAPVKQIYYMPLAYSGDDLRGAIYAGVVSATMNLQLQINPTPFVGATNELSAVYKGNAAGGWKAGSNVNIVVYQVYLDQLPNYNGGPVLPIMDLNTIYELKSTSLTGIPAGQDFPLPYSNYRDFLSTTVVYDNNGVFASGSDLNYFALTSANFTNLFKLPPSIVALEQRQVLMADPPPGTYYFDSRKKPINTITYGNMDLNVNAIAPNALARLVVGFEAFAQTNQILDRVTASLAAG